MRLIKLLGAGTILFTSFLTLKAYAGFRINATCTNSRGDVWVIKEGTWPDRGAAKLTKNRKLWKTYEKSGGSQGSGGHSSRYPEAEAVYEEKCAK